MKTKLMVRKLSRDILNLAMAISEERKTDVYVKYYPHVNEFDVEVFLDGYSFKPKEYVSYEINLINETAEESLKDVKEKLSVIWRNGKNE